MQLKKVAEITPVSDGGKIINSLDSNSTTDAPSIKAVNDILTRSTEEQRVGSWIDGKPLYRRVLTGNIQTSNKIFGTITNYKEIIKYDGICYVSSTGQWIPFSSGGKFTFSVNNEGVLARVSDANVAGSLCYLIIEYTKTTD